MLMSPADTFAHMFGAHAAYPELAGKRVLITGLSAANGVDIARGFADHRARLAIQVDEPCPQTDVLGEILAPSALELHMLPGALAGADAIVAFARKAVALMGGLDVVINLIPLQMGVDSGGNGMGVFVREGKGRKAIRHLYGPSVNQLFSGVVVEIEEPLKQMLEDDLMKEVADEMRAVVGALK